MAGNHWHFPRSELAETTLNLIVNGPTNAITMFGLRRMGKTEFLRDDLGPLAEKRGHRVIYINFLAIQTVSSCRFVKRTRDRIDQDFVC